MTKASLSTTHQPETGLIRRSVNETEGYIRSKTKFCLYDAAFCSSYTSPQQQHSSSVTTAQQQHNSTFTTPLQHRERLSSMHQPNDIQTLKRKKQKNKQPRDLNNDGRATN